MHQFHSFPKGYSTFFCRKRYRLFLQREWQAKWYRDCKFVYGIWSPLIYHHFQSSSGYYTKTKSMDQKHFKRLFTDRLWFDYSKRYDINAVPLFMNGTPKNISASIILKGIMLHPFALKHPPLEPIIVIVRKDVDFTPHLSTFLYVFAILFTKSLLHISVATCLPCSLKTAIPFYDW